MMRLDLATEAYIGARAQQQDAAAARGFGEKGGAVLVLADGLGGHTGGADASRIVVEAFREAADAGEFDLETDRFPALRRALDAANERIGRSVDPADGHRGMASTAVAAVIADGQVRWISVGDSHLYLLRQGTLTKLNEDHSQAGVLLRTGQYQPDDPEVLAAKSVLISALTGRRLEIVDHPKEALDLSDGDMLVLASDGLNTLDVDEIEALLSQSAASNAKEISTRLIDTVRDRRADRQDNTAVVVARIAVLPEVRAETNTTAVTAIAVAPLADHAPDSPEPAPRDDAAVTTRTQTQRLTAAAGLTTPTPPASHAHAGEAKLSADLAARNATENHGPIQVLPAAEKVASTATGAPHLVTQKVRSAGASSSVDMRSRPPAPHPSGDGSPPPHPTTARPGETRGAAAVDPSAASPAKPRSRGAVGLILAVLAGLGIAAAATYVLLTWRHIDSDPATATGAPSTDLPAAQTKSATPASAPATAIPNPASQPVTVAPPRQLRPAAPAPLPAPGARPVPVLPSSPQRPAPQPPGATPTRPPPTLTPGADEAAPPGKGVAVEIDNRSADVSIAPGGIRRL